MRHSKQESEHPPSANRSSRSRERFMGIRTFTIGPAPPDSFAAAMAHAGKPVSVLDLRQAEGETARWLAAPHPLRSIGAAFSSEAAMVKPIVLSRAFDAVIFVDRTTGSVPLQRSKQE